MMKNTREIPWVRIAAEATAVLVSILLAFAIDALWAERLERVAEREELSRLYDEFASNRDRILAGSKLHEAAVEASLRLYEIMDAAISSGAETIAVPDMVIADLVNAPTFEAETPVFDGLVRSGRIEIIEDRRILTTMAVWERTLRNTFEHEVRARQFMETILLPELADLGEIRHVLLNQNSLTQLVSLDPDGESVLRVDSSFVNLVAQRYFHTALVVRFMTRTRESADHVLSAISESVGE